MQEFKGTPGPWHVSNEGCMLIRDDAGLSIVAKYVGYTNDEEELANARLISAAPELLEALDKLVTEYIFTRSQLNGDEPDEMEDILCVKNARRAIAKAIRK